MHPQAEQCHIWHCLHGARLCWTLSTEEVLRLVTGVGPTADPSTSSTMRAHHVLASRERYGPVIQAERNSAGTGRSVTACGGKRWPPASFARMSPAVASHHTGAMETGRAITSLAWPTNDTTLTGPASCLAGPGSGTRTLQRLVIPPDAGPGWQAQLNMMPSLVY